MTQKVATPKKRHVKMAGGYAKGARTKVAHSTTDALARAQMDAPPTPPPAMAAVKRKLALLALLGNRPTHRPIVEMQGPRAASILASLLAQGRSEDAEGNDRTDHVTNLEATLT